MLDWLRMGVVRPPADWSAVGATLLFARYVRLPHAQCECKSKSGHIEYLHRIYTTVEGPERLTWGETPLGPCKAGGWRHAQKRRGLRALDRAIRSSQ